MWKILGYPNILAELLQPQHTIFILRFNSKSTENKKLNKDLQSTTKFYLGDFQTHLLSFYEYESTSF